MMLDKTNEQINISKQCELAGVSKSSVYYKMRPEKDENIALMNQIDELHTTRPYYGARRIQKQLTSEEKPVNVKRIRRLMKKMALNVSYPKPSTSRQMPMHKKYPYLLRGVEINRVNQVWSMDITYLKMNRGYMYLTAVIDWHSRYVLSWKVSNTMMVGFCKECLQEAIDNYGKPEVFNTDQGSQFTSPQFISIWEENNLQEVKISMDGRGRATDNAFIERLWRSVKQENVYRNNYKDGMGIWLGLVEYFDFYNSERLHQSLDYQTPEKIYFNKQQENKSFLLPSKGDFD
jgi:putative transposase